MTLANQTDAETQTIFEHLAELRYRLVRIVVTVALTTMVSFFFAERVVQLLLYPAGGLIDKLRVQSPPETIANFMRVSLVVGIAIASPIIMYHIVRFLAPGLKPNEKRWLYSTLPFIAGLFLVGAGFAYFVVLPAMLPFLFAFGNSVAEPEWRMDYYLPFVAQMLLAAGVIFEMPLVVFFLAKIGVVNHRMLIKYWKHALLIIFVAAAIITPTPDPFNQLLVAIPMILLYMLSIILARFA
ncbi:MAG: twin-arginine translocase subunit TatC [Chloroflexi bacterium]|nr:twin-arginine translocase subunit TatC [Chloroflexota bacterium]MBU1746547.1 twin-arginine translocase subunit TatC [Chloroflexota bacterium]